MEPVRLVRLRERAVRRRRPGSPAERNSESRRSSGSSPGIGRCPAGDPRTAGRSCRGGRTEGVRRIARVGAGIRQAAGAEGTSRGTAKARHAPHPRTAPQIGTQHRDGRRRGEAAARPGEGHRHQHGGQPHGPHRDERARHPGEAPDRQPRGHQQPPRPRPGRQSILHAPDRLRHHPRTGPVPVTERVLRRRGRQALVGAAGARQLRPGHRHAEAGRLPITRGAEHQEGREHELLGVLARLRGAREEGARRQARRR